jgi:hypothetical protein
MNLLGTSPKIAFDRRYPAEYRIASYLVRIAGVMTESYREGEHVGVTDFFFGPQPAWGPLPFATDALDVDAWRPKLLRAMWSSASDALLDRQPSARWYAEKLAADETPLREAGVELFTIDLVRDPRDVLASRHAFRAAGTESWERDAPNVAAELATRLNELEARPPDLRLRYEDLACDLVSTAERLAERLGVDLDPLAIDRPAHHITTPSAAASVGRWRQELNESEAAALAPIADRLGY